MGMLEAIGEVFPDARYQRCIVHFYRNVFTVIPKQKVLERLNKEIKRRTKVVGIFPDGQSALMLVCARLRHAISSDWDNKRYLNMENLRSMLIT